MLIIRHIQNLKKVRAGAKNLCYKSHNYIASLEYATCIYVCYYYTKYSGCLKGVGMSV